MNGEKKPPADGGNSTSEDVSSVSSTTRVVQIQVMDAPARPPLSRSPSLTLSEATPCTHRSSVSPYFQVHEPLSGYQSDRETIVHKPDSATIQETHMLRNEGVRDVYYTEEHWSSVVKSYVTNVPPKFKQMIKAYRVKSTDRLTLFVEVTSQPPALFQWFCNDRPVNSADADSESPLPQKRFTVNHGTNVSTLTVESPDQGVYSCSAQNPAGISRSYGYITIDDTQSYKEVTTKPSASTALAPQPQRLRKRKAPKFSNQIPHFVLKPSEEALIDVEVDSSAAPVKFTWYVDGRQILASDKNVVFYTPTPSRSVAQFRLPSSGQYTVVAQNQYGASKSTGFIKVQTDPIVDSYLYLLQSTAATLPPSSGALSPVAALATARGRSVTKRTVRTTTFVHRSSSLPRTKFPDDKEVAKLLRGSQTPERSSGVSPEKPLQRQLSGGRPQAPVFITGLPAEIVLNSSERLVLSVEVSAAPTAEIAWYLDGESVDQLDSFRILTETNRSTLVVDAPVRGGQYGVSAGNGVGQPLTQSTAVRFSIEGNSVSQITRDAPLVTVGELGSVTDGNGITKVVVQNEEIIEEHSDSEPEEEEHGDANVFVKTFVDPFRAQTEVDTAAVSVEGGEPPLSPLLQRITTPQSRAMIPSIVSAPETQIFVPGGLPLVLELRATSETLCTIRWYYRNFELRPIAGMITVDDSEANCCRVTYANPPEGIFKAVVTNEFGIANFETRVLVEFPEGRRSATGMSLDETAPDFMRRRSSAMSAKPEISLKMEKRSSLASSEGLDRSPKLILAPESVYRIYDGDTLTLEARADAQPEADFQWRQNNFEAHHGKHVKIERVGQNHSRAFFEQPAAGRYEVTATNRLGRDSAATKIIVEFEGHNVDKTPKVEQKRQMKADIDESAVDEKKKISAITADADAEEAKYLAVTMQEETKDETTNIQKEEESYSLLVKVAESLAQTLVADIFVSALHVMAKHLTDDAKTQQVNVGEDDDLTRADSTLSAPKITVQTVKLTEVDLEVQVFIEKMDEIFECDVIIKISEEYSVEESTKHSQKSSTERRRSAQKSKIPVKSKPKEARDEEIPTLLKEIVEEEDNQLSDFEKSAEQLAEELKQLEKDLRDTELSSLSAIAEIPASAVDLGEEFEHIEIPTEPQAIVLIDNIIQGTSAEELSYDMPATIKPIVEVTTASKENDNSRVADSSTPELLDVSETRPTLVESISSEEEAFYACQRAALDFPDDMSTSSADQSGQPPIFHNGLCDVQLTAGSTAHLKCVVTGMPTPEIDWFVDGDLINDLTNYDIIYEDGVVLLRFHSLIPEDEGEYVCEARNSHGITFTKCFVRVVRG